MNKGPVLKLCECSFFQLKDLIPTRMEAMGWWNGSDGFIKLCLELNSQSFTRGFSKDRFHDDMLTILQLTSTEVSSYIDSDVDSDVGVAVKPNTT
jgi:hypothetical protein